MNVEKKSKAVRWIVATASLVAALGVMPLFVGPANSRLINFQTVDAETGATITAQVTDFERWTKLPLDQLGVDWISSWRRRTGVTGAEGVELRVGASHRIIFIVTGYHVAVFGGSDSRLSISGPNGPDVSYPATNKVIIRMKKR